jgi:HPt (histidine-containing phosphotransfer) domain-containing protein
MTVINREKLSAVLQMSQQHQAQLLLMVANMLDDAENNIEQIQQYVQQQQRLKLQQLLHKIRGGYATLGAETLAQTSRALEHLLETDAPFNQADIADFVSIYRQTCTEMRTELTRYPQDSPRQNQPLHLNQLYTMLIQQDMQACQLVQASLSELEQLLTPAGAARLNQHIAVLDFVTAAQILEPHLARHRRSKQ